MVVRGFLTVYRRRNKKKIEVIALRVMKFGREICGNTILAESREWLVTNGIGGYASGTIAGMLTRRYHGLLIAALKPPVRRTLLLTKLDETVEYNGQFYPLFTNRWADGSVSPQGNLYLESFHLDGTIPVWRFALADALLEKRIWMQQGENTTYISYRLRRSTKPMKLAIATLVNHRGHHHQTHAHDWQMTMTSVDNGVCVNCSANQEIALYLRICTACDSEKLNGVKIEPVHRWYYGFYLNQERDRGLDYCEDHLQVATFRTELQPEETITVVASTEEFPTLAPEQSLKAQKKYQKHLIKNSGHKQRKAKETKPYRLAKKAPNWIKQLVLAADQFIVNRPLPDTPEGKTIIAGYPWFSDWGRDTMIALPGLTLCTGRSEIARTVLQTFAKYVDGGMLPNTFPEAGETPHYNTADATLWYFEAIRAYYEATGDVQLVRELWPVLIDIIDWHRRGTRYNIHLDPTDGLIYCGELGTQLTWMDAKVGDWVVTPRIGKPVEVNALWYNALQTMVEFADLMYYPASKYQQMAEQAIAGFSRFWNPELGYCYDVIDGLQDHDDSLRPNQIFAVSLCHSPLTPAKQRGVVDSCARSLVTSYGLRSLSPDHPAYKGYYTGDRFERDGAYHQGTVWGWLLGPFVLAHLRVYHQPKQAQAFLQPMANHLVDACVGSLSEIFDGNAPMRPKGAIAQAWTVAEVLRAAAYLKIKHSK